MFKALNQQFQNIMASTLMTLNSQSHNNINPPNIKYIFDKLFNKFCGQYYWAKCLGCFPSIAAFSFVISQLHLYTNKYMSYDTGRPQSNGRGSYSQSAASASAD